MDVGQIHPNLGNLDHNFVTVGESGRIRYPKMSKIVYREYSFTVAYLGEGPLRLPPFQPTIIFYDGIFGSFTNIFFLNIKI